MSAHSMHTYNVIFKRSHCIADVSFFEYISNVLSNAEEVALTRTNISFLPEFGLKGASLNSNIR